MKKLALSIIACMLAAFGASGQTIMQNDAFWDGDHILMATVQKSGNVVLKGRNLNDDYLSITLKKDAKAKGIYVLQKGDGDAPYMCKWGSRVRYIRQNGMNFLAFYAADNTINQVAVLTPDNLINNSDQQAGAEEEDPMTIVSTRLLNQHHLATLLPEVQEAMADQLRAKQRRSLVEQTNLQMINNALREGLFCSGEEPQEDEMEAQTLYPDIDKIITVSNERQFIDALGSNRTVQIADGTTLYLTTLLDDPDFFDAPGRAWRNDYYAERNGSEELIVSCERFDGRQLDLVNMHNLTIKGGKGCSIIVSPRYACVLNFYGCSNIRLENLTLGHTEEGYCEGSVVYVEGCEAINISDCDLYGCGTYGIEGLRNHGLVMERSIIRDCSYGIIALRGCQYFTFRNCDFYRCRHFDLIETDDACVSLKFDGCRFAQNQGTLFANRGVITLEGCEIYHEGEAGSGAELISYKGKKTDWRNFDKQLPERIIGPTKM